jgi:hypothetical protein
MACKIANCRCVSEVTLCPNWEDEPNPPKSEPEQHQMHAFLELGRDPRGTALKRR